jgi:hypothetical protein
MGGQGDTVQRTAKPPRDLQIHYRERDGDAEAPVQHIVEATVADVVIVAFVAEETIMAEQDTIRRIHEFMPVRQGTRDSVDLGCQRVEYANPRRCFETRVFEPGDVEGGAIESRGRTALGK